MLTEVVAMMAIVGVMTGIAIVDVGKVISHARSLSALTSVASVLSTARLQAVRRSTQIVVEISQEPPPTRRISLRTFEDRSGDFLLGTYTPPLPATLPVSETILSDFQVDATYHLWKKGGTKDDIESSALFNGYGNDSTIKQRIVFLPDGGMSAPQSADSAAPAALAGRGLYVADVNGKSFFRITMPTLLMARPRIDRYVDASSGYAATGWSW